MESRQSKLTDVLKTAAGLADLFNSDLFQRNLLPYLRQMSTVPYVYPKEGQSDEQYMFELRVANIKAGAYADLLKFLEGQNARVASLTKELEDIDKKEKYERGEE